MRRTARVSRRICFDIALELQSCLSGRIRKSFDAAVIHVTAAIEHDLLDTGAQCALGNSLCPLLSPRPRSHRSWNFRAISYRRYLLQPACARFDRQSPVRKCGRASDTRTAGAAPECPQHAGARVGAPRPGEDCATACEPILPRRFSLFPGARNGPAITTKSWLRPPCRPSSSSVHQPGECPFAYMDREAASCVCRRPPGPLERGRRR